MVFVPKLRPPHFSTNANSHHGKHRGFVIYFDPIQANIDQQLKAECTRVNQCGEINAKQATLDQQLKAECTRGNKVSCDNERLKRKTLDCPMKY